MVAKKVVYVTYANMFTRRFWEANIPFFDCIDILFQIVWQWSKTPIRDLFSENQCLRSPEMSKSRYAFIHKNWRPETKKYDMMLGFYAVPGVLKKVTVPSRKLTYPPKNGIFEDDFPFPKVGYVNSLECTFSCRHFFDAKNIYKQQRSHLGKKMVWKFVLEFLWNCCNHWKFMIKKSYKSSKTAVFCFSGLFCAISSDDLTWLNFWHNFFDVILPHCPKRKPSHFCP